MYVNVTFLIQVINFLVTYWVLNRVLFRPFLASLQKKQSYEQGLVDFLKKENVTLKDLEAEKVSKLLDFQHHVSKSYGVQETKRPELVEHEVPEAKASQITNYIEVAKDFLVKKISKGY